MVWWTSRTFSRTVNSFVFVQLSFLLNWGGMLVLAVRTLEGYVLGRSTTTSPPTLRLFAAFLLPTTGHNGQAIYFWPGHLFLAGPPVSGQAIQSAWKCPHSSVKRPPISRDISRAIQLHFATRYRILQGTCKIASWTDYSPGNSRRVAARLPTAPLLRTPVSLGQVPPDALSFRLYIAANWPSR